MNYKVKDRTGKLETINESKFVVFLYNTKIGRILLQMINKKIISKIIGFYYDSKISTLLIKPFIKKNNINPDEYQRVKYKCFNDFFTRKIKINKRPINKENNTLISPCDSKLMVYKIDDSLSFNIKHSKYSIKELLNTELNNYYQDGYALVFRLGVDDYHRYSYIDDGKSLSKYHINGVLHTVRPVAIQKEKVFIQNDREINELDTKNFGKVYMIEIGAIGVGKIINHDKLKFNRGEEKGYFKFGGSTIVLLINNIIIDEDILINSKNNIETKVKLGETIGQRKIKSNNKNK